MAQKSAHSRRGGGSSNAARAQMLPVADVQGQADLELANQLKRDADDPDEVRKALDDAAGMSRNLWLAYLTFGTYLVITVNSVSHRDLFLETRLKLPLFFVDLPLVSFFVVAPILFVIFHVYLLLNLKLMVDNVGRFNKMLARARLSPEEDDNYRLLLTNFPFVQLLAGTSLARHGWLLRLVVWLTVVIAPLGLLLLVQLQFLPYHHRWVTWVHRGAILTDLVLLCWLWPQIIAGESRVRLFANRGGLITLTVLILFFAVFVATFPSEPVDAQEVARKYPWLPRWAQVSRPLHEGLFLGEVDEVNGRRNSIWSNTLVLSDEDFVDDKELDKVDTTHSLRGRDLRGAVLVRTDLRKADFTGAHLDGADLSRGRFDQASFGCAKKGSKTLEDATRGEGCTTLVGATLDNARLRAANLHYAHLEGASLDHAYLQTAQLIGTRLLGANLDDAQLQGSNLLKAELKVASLARAQLQGAILDGANLAGASLASAIVWCSQHKEMKTQLSDLKNLVERRYYVGDDQKLAELDDKKVIDAAKKDASPGLVKKIEKELGFLREKNKDDVPCDEDVSNQFWAEEKRNQEPSLVYEWNLAEYFSNLICQPEDLDPSLKDLDPSFLIHILDSNHRLRAANPYLKNVEQKLFDLSACPGAARLTDEAKDLLRKAIMPLSRCAPDEKPTERSGSVSAGKVPCGQDDEHPAE